MSRKTGQAETILREQGARVTPQRVAILRALEATGTHPDADAGGWMWYLGMAGAVGLGVWAYFTNKK